MRNITAAMAEILSTNIKRLRLHLGLDQTKFGEEIGVSQATVARWEKDSNPRPEHLMKMVDLAECSLQEFMSKLWSADAPRQPSTGSRPSTDAGILMMPVLLPSEEDLTDMFQSLLDILAREPDLTVTAHRLAQLLPDALAQTIARQPARRRGPDAPPAPGEGAPPPPTDGPEPRP